MTDLLLKFTVLSAATCVLILLAGLVYLLVVGNKFSERVMKLVFWLLLTCLIGPASFLVFVALQAVFRS